MGKTCEYGGKSVPQLCYDTKQRGRDIEDVVQVPDRLSDNLVDEKDYATNKNQPYSDLRKLNALSFPSL